MRKRCVPALIWILLAAAPALADEPLALAKARALYNAGDYDGAIAAAGAARALPAWSDAAALVMARSRLERYRLHADPADLSSSRELLAGIHADALDSRDRVDLIIGLGQSLYLGERFGAAAELFESALHQAYLLDDRGALLLLDWWATALDREAQSRPAEGRTAVYRRILDRMETELRADAANPAANYWLAAAARGSGDIERAWSAAVAAWVRAPLSPSTARDLRQDIDRLVTQALIPERARTRPPREQAEASTALHAEWELIKMQWP